MRLTGTVAHSAFATKCTSNTTKVPQNAQFQKENYYFSSEAHPQIQILLLVQNLDLPRPLGVFGLLSISYLRPGDAIDN